MGNSSKGRNYTAGSFGYGKAAYFNVSQLGAILVSTLTNTGEYCFQGSAYLSSFDKDGVLHMPNLFYDNNNGNAVVDPSSIPDEFLRKEPGTNFYILGVDAFKKINEMIEYVLVHFWLAIYDKKLVVRFKVEDNAELFPETEIQI